MITRLFLQRLSAPDWRERAYVIAPLFRAFLNEWLDPAMRREIMGGLTSVLGDRSSLVRKSLANTLAHSPRAPRHLIVALSRDQMEIAAPVILYSPLLRSCDLIELIAESDEPICEIIAARLYLTTDVSAVLARFAGPSSCVGLLCNPTASIDSESMSMIAKRYVDDPQVRSALFGRHDLPVTLRQRLMTTLCDVLGRHITDSRLSPLRRRRVMRETWEKMTLGILHMADEDDLRVLIRDLGSENRLTTSLLLRALVQGDFAFFLGSLAYLSHIPVWRAQNLVRDRSGTGFRALYEHAGLPWIAYEIFVVAVARVLELIDKEGQPLNVRQRRMLLENLLAVCEQRSFKDSGMVLGYLIRLYDETMHEEAMDEDNGSIIVYPIIDVAA